MPGNRATIAIFKVGPYRFRRNPIYLAVSQFQTGIEFMVNHAWLPVTRLPTTAVIFSLFFHEAGGKVSHKS